MSLGYTGMCKKELEDDELVIYSYSGENWNDNGKSKKIKKNRKNDLTEVEKDIKM